MLKVPRAESLRLLLLVAFAVTLVACSRDSAEDPPYIAVEPPQGPGELQLTNASSSPVTWIWVSPTDADDLSYGAELVLDEPLAPGSDLAVEVPSGWWTLWIENVDGADALLHRVWFDAESATELEVTDTWWEMGDFIGESAPASDEE